MKYRVWYSTESFADYIIAKTDLHSRTVIKKKLYESDANNPKNFHSLPDHIKQILYLDAPDLIIELDAEPIFSIELSTEAGTGHNAFQRFARLAASVENGVPAFYIYPEAAIIQRQDKEPNWDKINPLIFKALEDVMTLYQIPALLYYFPSDFQSFPVAGTSPNLRTKGLKYEAIRAYSGSPDSSDAEMKDMFEAMNEIISVVEHSGAIEGRKKLLSKKTLSHRKSLMQQEYAKKGGNLQMSPLSATQKISTQYLINHLSVYQKRNYKIGELLRSRDQTILYQVNAAFRGDPYPGALAAIDYLLCREGKTFEERKYNLVMCWGAIAVDEKKKNFTLSSIQSTIHDFVKDVQASGSKSLLTKDYQQIQPGEISRYYMQVRYGSMFSKVKHIRVFSYFADAILFPDGALWRDA